MNALSPRELRAAYREALATEGRASEDLPGDEMMLAVALGPETSVRIDLTRLYTELQRTDDADQRAQRFRDFLAATLEAIRNAEGTQDAPTRDQLVPVLKGKFWVDALPPNAIAIEPLAGDVCVVYAFDQPHSFAFAPPGELAQLGIAPADLRELALDNLRERLPDDLATQGDGLSFMFTIGGNFEASLLLLPELWDHMEDVPGEIVACALARDICLFTGTATPGGVDSLVAARDRILESMPPHDLISPALLVRRRGAWELYRAA